MQHFRHGLSKAVGQCLHHDRGIIIVRPLEALGNGDLFNPGCHDEAANVIGLAAFDRRDEIG